MLQIKNIAIGAVTVIVLFAVAYAAHQMSMIVALMVSGLQSDFNNIWRLCAEVAISTAITFIAFALLNRYLLKGLLKPFHKAPNVFNLKTLVYWGALAVILLAIITMVFKLIGTVQIETVGQVSLAWGVIWGAIFFIQVGIGEEIAYRWFFYGAVKKKYGYMIAVITNGIVFGLVHINQVDNLPDALLLMLAAFSVSYLLIIIYEITGSIWAGAVFHGVWDLFTQGTGITLVNALERKEGFTFHAIDVVVDHPLYAISGGGFGVEASIIASATMFGAAFLLQALFKKKDSV